MTTFTINTNARRLQAVSDVYTTNEIDTISLNVLDNDILGVEPTIITSIDTLGFTLGTITIEVGDETLEFVPNGNIGTSSFTYTITDDLSRISVGVVHITTIEVL